MNRKGDKVLNSYVEMILNGDAFSNWKHKPDINNRKRIVENLLELNGFSERVDIIMSEIEKVNTEKELNKLIKEWELKEEEFMI